MYTACTRRHQWRRVCIGIAIIGLVIVLGHLGWVWFKAESGLSASRALASLVMWVGISASAAVTAVFLWLSDSPALGALLRALAEDDRRPPLRVVTKESDGPRAV